MKRIMKGAAVVLCAGLLLCGCSSKGTENSSDAATTAGDNLTALPDYTWDGVDVDSYVTLGAYEGIEYKPASAEVSEEEVDEVIEQLRDGSATTEEITEGAVADGDTVNIDYVGRIDGEAFEGGSAQNQTITIGVTSMIPGFTEGLIDQEVGQDVVLDLTFPEDYWNADYAGKDAEFTITINYIAGEKIVPELTDEWAATVTSNQYTTVEALRNYLRESLEAEAESSAEEEDQLAVWSQVVENATISGYPEGALDYYFAAQKRQIEEYAGYYGLDYDSFVKNLGYTEEQMIEDLTESSKNYADNVMVARALVKALGQEVTEEEYREYIEEMAAQYGYDDVGQLVEDYGGRLTVLDDMVLGRALEHVQSKAVAK